MLTEMRRKDRPEFWSDTLQVEEDEKKRKQR